MHTTGRRRNLQVMHEVGSFFRDLHELSFLSTCLAFDVRRIFFFFLLFTKVRNIWYADPKNVAKSPSGRGRLIRFVGRARIASFQIACSRRGPRTLVVHFATFQVRRERARIVTPAIHPCHAGMVSPFPLSKFDYFDQGPRLLADFSLPNCHSDHKTQRLRFCVFVNKITKSRSERVVRPSCHFLSKGEDRGKTVK